MASIDLCGRVYQSKLGYISIRYGIIEAISRNMVGVGEPVPGMFILYI